MIPIAIHIPTGFSFFDLFRDSFDVVNTACGINNNTYGSVDRCLGNPGDFISVRINNRKSN